MSRWIASVCVVVLVGTAIAIVQVPTRAGDSWLAILWAAWVIAVVWALTRQSFSLLFAAIMAAMFLYVILPATEAQLSGLTTIAGDDFSAGIPRALEIAALAQCGMLAGAVAARALRPVPRLIKLSPRLSPSLLDKAARRSVYVGVVGVIAFSVVGGANLRSFFVYTTSTGYGTFNSEATGKLAYLGAIQGITGLAVVLLPLRLGCSGSSRWPALLLAALATFVLLGGGQRVWFFLPAFAAVLIWLKTSKRSLAPRRVIVVGVLVLIVLGGLVGVARGASSDRHVTVDAIIADSFGPGNDLFLPLAGLATTVPGQIPYLGGSSYLQVAEFVIPRGLWSGKPVGSIVQVVAVMDPRHSGIAFPEFGEMYANFGLPGVLIGSLLLGVLIELFSRRFARSTSIRESVFMAVWGAVLLLVFTRGDIAPMFTSFEGLLVATALVCRRRSPTLAVARASAPSESLKPHQISGSAVAP